MKAAKLFAGIVLLAGVAALSGCKTPTKVSSAYARHDFAVECLGTDHDGSQTVRAWGKGKNKKAALEAAKRNAVHAVIFDGINAGTGGCSKAPLINTPNAERRHEDYFNGFFADGGAYSRFVTMEDEKRTSRLQSEGKEMENWGFVLHVDRVGLRNLLREAGLINN